MQHGSLRFGRALKMPFQPTWLANGCVARCTSLGLLFIYEYYVFGNPSHWGPRMLRSLFFFRTEGPDSPHKCIVFSCFRVAILLAS